MMYRKPQMRVQTTNADLLLQRRVLLAVCAVLLAAAVFLGAAVIRGGAYENKIKTQFSQRMYSACTSALDEVNRLGSIVTTNASARLARVRQYVYYMEQLNAMSISLAGGESGRLADADAFTALYADLENFEGLIQQSTSTTLDARSTLLTHLQLLQSQLNAD